MVDLYFASLTGQQAILFVLVGFALGRWVGEWLTGKGWG